MATNQRPPEQPRRKMIVAPKVGAGGCLAAFKLISVLMVSAVLHGGMLLAFYYIMMFIGLNKVQADDNNVEVAVVTQVEEDTHDTDLSNIDIGSDPTLQLNYNVDRIEDVSVPGPVDPTAAVGIPGAPEAMRQNVPAPPGTGGGTGAGVPSLDVGSGGIYGTPGGYGNGIMIGRRLRRPQRRHARQDAARKAAATQNPRRAVARGLKWFALHQAPDGHWSLNDFQRFAHADEPSPASKTFVCTCTGQVGRQDDTAGTGFGLLPFLAGGFTHKPNNDPKQIDYSKTVKAGLDFLIAKQGKDGFFGGTMYSHGLATIAMCEAYGMTSDPMLKNARPARHQLHRGGPGPRRRRLALQPRTAGDTSVTGWQLMALKSGQMAGLDVPKETLKKTESFLDAVASTTRAATATCPAAGRRR